MRSPTVTNLFQLKDLYPGYQPRAAPHFRPDTIVITKGSFSTQQSNLAEAICRVYPKARIIDKSALPHNRVELDSTDPLELHYKGKKTLVLGIHKSAVRYSDEDGNTCPNYWHFSPYGFCPYDCQYCYLAGTPGVKYSPTVKIFLNLPEILDRIHRTASRLAKPAAFYLGKLQDALALDPLTGYSRIMIPFFAEHDYARFILLTKSANVDNLLDLDHRGHTILSWSLNPPEIASEFELDVPSPTQRIAAMRKCAEVGYHVRAVIMPIIPVDHWRHIYSEFLQNLVNSVQLSRITFGQICSYSAALRLTERKLGAKNPISNHLERRKSTDGRLRFPLELRIRVYRHLIEVVRQHRPDLPIGLCMEEEQTFESLNMKNEMGACNCVL